MSERKRFRNSSCWFVRWRTSRVLVLRPVSIPQTCLPSDSLSLRWVVHQNAAFMVAARRRTEQGVQWPNEEKKETEQNEPEKGFGSRASALAKAGDQKKPYDPFG